MYAMEGAVPVPIFHPITVHYVPLLRQVYELLEVGALTSSRVTDSDCLGRWVLSPRFRKLQP